ncbi:MAG: histidine--tRNA ligase [Candidatus Woesearchaeota archaeon]
MFQRVKGTNDFYPKDYFIHRQVMEKMAKTCDRYGFSPVLTPSIETFKLLSAKSGEEVKSQIFMLEKRGAEELSLKPELTPGITRMFVAMQRQVPKPVKWYSVDRMWRYEAPQKGREREFFQISVEQFGSDKPEADAEIINLFIDCLLSTGLKPRDFTVKINHRNLLGGILQEIVPKAKVEEAMRIVDKGEKLDEKEYFLEMGKAGISGPAAERIRHATRIKGKPADVEREISRHLQLNDAALNGWKSLKQILSMVKHDNIVVDLSIARGFAYYTGCVFEAFDSQGLFRALGGGGRYDQLTGVFGGEACPATGFGIGYSTVSLLLQQKKLLPQPVCGPDYFVAPISEEMIPEALKIAHQLRAKYSVDIDLMRRKISKQFEYANSIGAKKVVVVGPEELKTKKFTIKDMKTGKEEKKQISEL